LKLIFIQRKHLTLKMVSLKYQIK